jgi:predicted nucleic acid-binding protein
MVDTPTDEAIRSFPVVSAIDTCAIWNILCSKILVSAAMQQNLHFMLAEYVRYECLVKLRRSTSEIESKMRIKLVELLAANRGFSVNQLAVDDLSGLIRAIGSPRRFDKGELAALALALKYRNGFLTDDRAARKAGEKVVGASQVRTTPHLVGWLVYTGHLVDGDIPAIKTDNLAFRGNNGNLGKFIQECYEHALGLRLRDRRV